MTALAPGGEQPWPLGSRRIPAVVRDAREVARETRAEGGRQAAELLVQARAEAEALRAAAVSTGREEGLARATEVVARAALLHDRLLARAEPDLVELALAVAGRVLSRIVERDGGAVVELAARALEAARQRTEVSIRAHPEDLAALRAAEPQLLGVLVRARRLDLVGDATVERGGAVVETEAGSYDARLAQQLEGLGRALRAGGEGGEGVPW
jgi:flagellar biosynthesis/type III secretory pathway protein FliH